LPPGFDPKKRYPFILWLHGMDQDEKGALEKGLPQLDAAMASGRFPPVIIAVPDGSIRGRPALFFSHSSFLNGRSGNYEDYLFDDVYDFVRRNFPLRPEREAHVLAGASLGGGSAFHHAIARRDQFGIVVGVFPPLNVRWVGSHGRYFANFDPDSWGWREHYHAGARPIGKFFGGLVSVPLRRVVHPLYGSGNQVISQMSRDNPIEMLDTHDVRPGELDMLVAYGGRDEFNIDAQVESFLYRSSERGLNVHVLYDPRGRHNAATAVRLLPGIHEWLAPRLERFHPDRVE
jgi:S-formylglutathione hydrolase FrmB